MPTKEISQKFLTFRKFKEKPPSQIAYLLQNLTFRRVWFSPQDGDLTNIHLLYQMLPTIEDYNAVFNDEALLKTDYDAWLEGVLQFIRQVGDWFFVVTEGEYPIYPHGLIWAHNWQSLGQQPFAVEIGGMAKRGTHPLKTTVAFYELVSRLFEETPVHIIRCEYVNTNRAARQCLTRLGFSHPEPRRCLKVQDGEEITGTIVSITRPEWEALHV